MVRWFYLFRKIHRKGFTMENKTKATQFERVVWGFFIGDPLRGEIKTYCRIAAEGAGL
jgi:hypothetical protein